MTTIEELQKKLKVAEKVGKNIYSLKPIDIFNLIQKGIASIIKFTPYKKIDPNVSSTWVDKIHSFDVNFLMYENKFSAKIKRYFDDCRGNVDTIFTAYIALPEDYILKCEKDIEYRYKLKLDEMYKNHLEDLKKEWIKNKSNEILAEK